MIFILGTKYGTIKNPLVKIGNMKLVQEESKNIQKVVDQYCDNNTTIIGFFNGVKCYIQSNLFYYISIKSLYNAISEFMTTADISDIVVQEAVDSDLNKYYVIIELNGILINNN